MHIIIATNTFSYPEIATTTTSHVDVIKFIIKVHSSPEMYFMGYKLWEQTFNPHGVII